MAKMTKAQTKRMLESIDAKCKKLWQNSGLYQIDIMSTKDMIAITNIVNKNLKKLK